MKQSTAGEATIVVRYLKFNVLHFICETAQLMTEAGFVTKYTAVQAP